MLSLSGPRRCHKVHFLLLCVHNHWLGIFTRGHSLSSSECTLPEVERAWAETKDAPGGKNG